MISDSIDVDSLVSYIKDVKPFHSKLTEVTVEYQANDDVFVSMKESKHTMDIKLSSVWDIQTVSDGVRTQYRIPAALFPRHSEQIHQCRRIGVTDEVPGTPGAYRVAHNNGINVTVNNVPMVEGTDYVVTGTLSPTERNIVQFLGTSIPLQDAVICLDIMVIDRIFVAVDGVWQSYNLVPASAFNQADDYDQDNLDAENFDSSEALADNQDSLVMTSDQDTSYVYPLGMVKKLLDQNGRDFYVFEFYNALPLNAQVWLRIEQRETYNGWTQTQIKEDFKWADQFKFEDPVGVQIADPSSWDRWLKLPVGFDQAEMEDIPYDALASMLPIAEYKSDFGLLSTDYVTNIQGLKAIMSGASTIAAAGMSISDALVYKQKNPGEFDEPPFDLPGFDSTKLNQGNVQMLTKQDLMVLFGAYVVIIRPNASFTQADVVDGNYTNIYWYNGFTIDPNDTSLPPIRSSTVPKQLESSSGTILNIQLPTGAILAQQTIWNFTDFQVDISDKRFGLFDIEPFDTNVFDSIPNPEVLGYYKLFAINIAYMDQPNFGITDSYSMQENVNDGQEAMAARILENLLINTIMQYSDSVGTTVTEVQNNISIPLGFDVSGMDVFPLDAVSPSDQTYPGFEDYAFDLINFDQADLVWPPLINIKKGTSQPDESTSTAIADAVNIMVTENGVSTSYSTYTPDITGTVYMTYPSNTVYIQHSYSGNPAVAVYLNGEQLWPAGVEYPGPGIVVVTFNAPRQAVIRLV